MEQPILLLVVFFVGLIVGLIVGTIAVWFILRARASTVDAEATGRNQAELVRINEQLNASQQAVTRLTTEHTDLQTRVMDWREKLGAAESTVINLTRQLEKLQGEKESLATHRDQLIGEQRHLSSQIAQLNTSLESEHEKLELLKNAEEHLVNRFKTVASEILDDKSKKFTDQNQTNLNHLLEPLKIKITEFQGLQQNQLACHIVLLRDSLCLVHYDFAALAAISEPRYGRQIVKY